jgi:hypothetical protein
MKRNGKDKIWERILDEQGNMITGNMNILKEQVNFYKQLYQHEPVNSNMAETFLESVTNRLNIDHKYLLNDDINIDELTNAVKMMKNNRSPGFDGIIIEFYKYFWNDVKNDILEVFTYSLTQGCLPHTQYLAVIRLLYKKGQREDLRNWRPISLLNSDIKILSKLLANRLKKVLPDIIHTDQTGCIQGRFIGQNIRLIQDLINKSDDDEVFLLLDQEKAFDRVDWNWLFKVLEKFGFTNKYVSWLKVMYKSMKSCILTNGYTSEFFSISRGIRQGDSLSALLYVIQAEPMACFIRKTNRVAGIDIKNKVEVRISQYVDDTVLCLKDFNMMKNALQIIEEFGEASGSRLNKKKTVGIVMNESLVSSIETDIELTLGPVKLLGIPIGKGINTNIFWDQLISKIEKRYNMWQARDLSMTGKVHIIKSIGMSTILYASNVLVLGEQYLTRITNLNYRFLWSGKRNLVKKEICTLPRNLGGLEMFDLYMAIKAQRIQWLKRILQGDCNEKWKAIALESMKCLDARFGIQFFALKVTDSSQFLDKVRIPIFYKNIILDLQELRRKTENHNQIIWCNNRIKFNGKPLAFTHWAKSGIVYVSEVTVNGKIREEYIREKLVNKASYIFDIMKLKTALKDIIIPPNNDGSENFNNDHELILNSVFIVNGARNAKLASLKSKDIYLMFLLNKGIEIKSSLYWQRKFNDSLISMDLWFTCNFISSIMPRKCIDFNWKLFHGKLSTETQLKRMKLSDGICSVCNNEFENADHLLQSNRDK